MKFAKFAMLLAALATFSFAEWDGTSKEPEKVNKIYEVTTPEELIWVLDHCYFPDSWNLANDIVFGKDTASLSPIVWNVQEQFNCDRNNLYLYGSFDGNNHTIYGINSHQSLFAYISGFKNLTIANSQFGGFDIDSVAPLALTAEGQLKNIEIRNTKIMAAKYAAGVVVENKFYVIPNDKTGGIKLDTVTSVQDIRVIGGSVESMGHAAGIFNVNGLAATNLYNSSTVTVIDTSTDCSGYQTDKIAAGLIGQMDAYYATYNSSLESISNSVNEGDVKVISKCGNVYAGGIAATSNGVFRNVENKGNIYGKTTTSTTYAGGILGHQDKTELGYYFNNKKLSNKGDVYGESSLYDYVGGIYGYTTGTALDSAFNEGSITGVATGKDSSYANVGGIIGYAIRLSSYGHFANLGNWGKIQGKSEKFVAAAGVIGRFGSPSNYPSSALLAALNYGDVDAHITTRSTYDAKLYAAGITAYSKFAPIYAVYNYGNITGDTDIENSIVAGLMAYGTSSTDYVTNGYNVSPKIIGKKNGALIAYGPLSRYDFTNCFNDKDVNPMKILVDTSAVTEEQLAEANVRNLTTEELQSDTLLNMFNSYQNQFYDEVLWKKGSRGYPVFLFDTTQASRDSNSTGEIDPPLICHKTQPNVTGFTVAISGHDVTLMNAKDEVSVFDLQGNRIARVKTIQGTAQFQLPATGSYILKSGRQAQSVTIK